MDHDPLWPLLQRIVLSNLHNLFLNLKFFILVCRKNSITCTRADGADLWDSWSHAEQRKGRCQELVLDGARMAEELESDDNEKDQLAERRSAAGIVSVDERKQKVE